ncbi:MAG: DMT family transporter [Pigmentiphaga sp.]|uniref:DMT family transporter n=1 Tax=Pigmentiphaga sp. TaxID=1977564 RepID=UPI0029BCB40E|nr:DMT family transporter [Pigmentiphaga sp.]MDX3907146.1 DMT family transporter [Pigmentiphaga sp.]
MISPFFVVIWSTGFVVARYGLPYAEPLTFLVLRFAGVLAAVGPVCLAAGTGWPGWRQAAHVSVAGVLLQAGYLGGVWIAIHQGMGAGLAALVVGLQPLLTAVAGRWLGEVVTPRQWTGLVLGVVGVGLVVENRLGTAGLTLQSLGFALAALVSITAGTLYQRRFCPRVDLRAGLLLQFGASLVVVLPAAMVFETMRIQWTWTFVGAWAWSVFALSIGAICLLFLLIRRGAATRVASLMYLTPAVTALMAWAAFGEPLTPAMLGGMALSAFAVAWAQGKR